MSDQPPRQKPRPPIRPPRPTPQHHPRTRVFSLRTISEASEELGVPQNILRFWETKFAQLKPLKRAAGRRYYRKKDMELLKRIAHLLYSQGYTIRQAQQALEKDSSDLQQPSV